MTQSFINKFKNLVGLSPSAEQKLNELVLMLNSLPDFPADLQFELIRPYFVVLIADAIQQKQQQKSIFVIDPQIEFFREISTLLDSFDDPKLGIINTREWKLLLHEMKAKEFLKLHKSMSYEMCNNSNKFRTRGQLFGFCNTNSRYFYHCCKTFRDALLNDYEKFKNNNRLYDDQIRKVISLVFVANNINVFTISSIKKTLKFVDNEIKTSDSQNVNLFYTLTKKYLMVINELLEKTFSEQTKNFLSSNAWDSRIYYFDKKTGLKEGFENFEVIEINAAGADLSFLEGETLILNRINLNDTIINGIKDSSIIQCDLQRAKCSNSAIKSTTSNFTGAHFSDSTVRADFCIFSDGQIKQSQIHVTRCNFSNCHIDSSTLIANYCNLNHSECLNSMITADERSLIKLDTSFEDDLKLLSPDYVYLLNLKYTCDFSQSTLDNVKIVVTGNNKINLANVDISKVTIHLPDYNEIKVINGLELNLKNTSTTVGNFNLNNEITFLKEGNFPNNAINHYLLWFLANAISTYTRQVGSSKNEALICLYQLKVNICYELFKDIKGNMYASPADIWKSFATKELTSSPLYEKIHAYYPDVHNYFELLNYAPASIKKNKVPTHFKEAAPLVMVTVLTKIIDHFQTEKMSQQISSTSEKKDKPASKNQ